MWAVDGIESHRELFKKRAEDFDGDEKAPGKFIRLMLYLGFVSRVMIEPLFHAITV